MKSATAVSCLLEEGCPGTGSSKNLSPAWSDRRNVGNLTARRRNLTSTDELTQLIDGVALYGSGDAFHVLGAVFLTCSQQSLHGRGNLPVVGPLLYKLNVNRVVVRYVAAGHVYADPAWLSDERQREKLAVTRAPGSRFASIRFVTGELDPIETRQQFLALARQAAIPMLMVYGNQTPPRSRAEMEALATIDGMQSVCIARGKLALHEEFADQVARDIAPFLAHA
jgi:hypothetical protein